MNPFQIRLAEKDDTGAILDIYAPFILNTTTSFEIEVPTEMEFYQLVQNILVESPFLVCLYHFKIVGYAYASPHRARQAYDWNREISVYVALEFHGKKIGSTLYITLIELLKLQGYANVLAGIAFPNPASISFHQKMGFRLIGTYEKIGYKFGRFVDTQWWALFIGENKMKAIHSLNDIRYKQKEEWEKAIQKGINTVKF